MSVRVVFGKPNLVPARQSPSIRLGKKDWKIEWRWKTASQTSTGGVETGVWFWTGVVIADEGRGREKIRALREGV